jgi:hypothetical protein
MLLILSHGEMQANRYCVSLPETDIFDCTAHE